MGFFGVNFFPFRGAVELFFRDIIFFLFENKFFQTYMSKTENNLSIKFARSIPPPPPNTIVPPLKLNGRSLQANIIHNFMYSVKPFVITDPIKITYN